MYDVFCLVQKYHINEQTCVGINVCIYWKCYL